MSNDVTNLCRRLRLPQTHKSVLMALADYCHDDGKDWHSIAALMEWTCLGRTAVIEALKALVAGQLIAIRRGGGSVTNTTFVQVERIANRPENQSPTRTGVPAEPVRHADGGGARGEPLPVRVADEPVRVADPKHQEASVEASGKHQRARTRVRQPEPSDLFPEVDKQVLIDWMQVRKDKRARTLTRTAADGLRREAARLGISAEQAIRLCAESGWQSIDATWERARVSAAALRGTTPARPLNRQEALEVRNRAHAATLHDGRAASVRAYAGPAAAKPPFRQPDVLAETNIAAVRSLAARTAE